MQDLFFSQVVTRKKIISKDATKAKAFDRDRLKLKREAKTFTYQRENNKSVQSRLYDRSKITLHRKPYQRIESASQQPLSKRRSINLQGLDKRKVILNITPKTQQSNTLENAAKGASGTFLLSLNQKQKTVSSKKKILNLKEPSESQPPFYSLDFISQKQWVVSK